MLRGLYAITDEYLTPLETMKMQVSAAIEGGAKIVQFRYKSEITADVLISISEIQKVCRDNGVLFIVNDHMNLAKEIDADGIHIGKEDADDLPSIRAQFPGKIIGVSCYGDMKRAFDAEAAGADYVAFGSFFFSPTKPKSGVVSPSIINEAKEKLTIPVCVIGGITVENAPELLREGADMVSVISSLWKSEDVEKRAREFDRLFAECVS